MKYSEFEKVVTRARMSRYLTACFGNTNTKLYGVDHVVETCNKTDYL